MHKPPDNIYSHFGLEQRRERDKAHPITEDCKKIKALACEYWLSHSMTNQPEVGALINKIVTILEKTIPKAEVLED